MAKKKKKTAAKLKFDLQKIFNKFIRLRDLDGDYFTCIACSETKPKERMNAGHFYAVKGYDSMRFNENNVHGECISCNCFNESHLIGYIRNIEDKIGSGALMELHQLAEDYKKFGYKWSRPELEEMIVEYKEKVNNLM